MDDKLKNRMENLLFCGNDRLKRAAAENVAVLEREFARKGLLVYRVENK